MNGGFRTSGVTLLTAFLLLRPSLPGVLEAQEGSTVTFGGQVRPRMEGRNPVEGSTDVFTSMRVRTGLEARLEGNLRVFVQLQDVRFFGEEDNTLNDFRADNFDLHQGYLELGSASGPMGAARVGRQELALGEQRLVGAVDWAQQGRSFDGVRYTTPSVLGFQADLFAMKLREEAAPTHTTEAEFYGAYGTVDLGIGGSLDLYALATTDSREDGAEEQTFGGLWAMIAGPMEVRVEGSVQTGQRGGEDVAAYMVGARLGGGFRDVAKLSLWYDHLSGDETSGDGEIGVFNTLFATNHPLYGLADYFTDIPVHTGGLGLRDAALKLALSPYPEARVNVDVHSFGTAQEGALSTQALANELDLTASYRFSTGFSVMGGYSFVQALDGIKELGRLEENTHWGYLMLTASF